MKAKSPTQIKATQAVPGVWQRFKQYWPVYTIAVVLLALIGISLYTLQAFSAKLNVDHAEHGSLKPSVHQIMHVRQKLVVGINDNRPPLSFKNAGQEVGFEVDLAKAIAREFNVPVEFKASTFSEAFSESNLDKKNLLNEGQVDIVIAGVSKSRYLEQFYAISKPYVEVGQVAIAKTSNAAITNSASLQGQTVAALPGSVGFIFAKSITTPDKIHEVNSMKEGVDAVSTGKVVAFIIDAPYAQKLVSQNEEIHVATDLLTIDEYTIITMRDKADLAEELNTIIEILRQRGVLESLRQKWLK